MLFHHRTLSHRRFPRVRSRDPRFDVKVSGNQENFAASEVGREMFNEGRCETDHGMIDFGPQRLWLLASLEREADRRRKVFDDLEPFGVVNLPPPASIF